MSSFWFRCRPHVLCGPGVFGQLGTLARDLGFRRPLLVSDPGIVAAGYSAQAVELLRQASIDTALFDRVGENPDTRMVEAGREAALAHNADSIIGLGGGSSLDCAKAVSFVVSNGGTMRDYWGYGKASQPLLPMIGVPTTTGTGSEAQTYALISDAQTHVKMACGNPDAAFRVVLLDPQLALTQPRNVLALAGYDAVSHAVETWVSTKRNSISEALSREAWRLLHANLEPAVLSPSLEAIGELQIGAYLAGLAIENSMLGAAHACANPLTARFGIVHGAALAMLLPHVVGWNAEALNGRYDLLETNLPSRLIQIREAAGLPTALRQHGVSLQDLDTLAEDAAQQWTGKFNPRPFSADSARALYEAAF